MTIEQLAAEIWHTIDFTQTFVGWVMQQHECSQDEAIAYIVNTYLPISNLLGNSLLTIV